MADKHWDYQLATAQEAMVNKKPVFIYEGKKPIKVELLKLDETNRVFTALLRLGKGHLKWVSLDKLNIF